MRTLNILLDNAQKVCSPKSDAAISRRLKVSRETVSAWRSGKSGIRDSHLAALIQLAQADPALAVLVREEGAATPAERALWGPLWDRLSPVTTVIGATLLMVTSLTLTPSSATPLAKAEPFAAMYIMRSVIRQLRKLFTGWTPSFRDGYGPAPVLA